MQQVSQKETLEQDSAPHTCISHGTQQSTNERTVGPLGVLRPKNRRPNRKRKQCIVVLRPDHFKISSRKCLKNLKNPKYQQLQTAQQFECDNGFGFDGFELVVITHEKSCNYVAGESEDLFHFFPDIRHRANPNPNPNTHPRVCRSLTKRL